MFETQRLLFRPFEEGDLGFYASLWNNPAIVRYIGSGRIKTEEEAEKTFYERILSGYENGLGLFMAIHKKSGQPAGQAGLVQQRVEGRVETEIGYWLTPDFWGQGLSVEAAESFRDYGFYTLDLKKLITLINPNHVHSIGVTRRIGMTYEKTAQFNGRDVLVYSLYRDPNFKQ